MGALVTLFFAFSFLTQVERFFHLEIMPSYSSHGFSSRGNNFRNSKSNNFSSSSSSDDGL